MQFSYSVNALVVTCGGEFADVDSCGTFLEVHKTNGSPYDDESVTLSATKVVTPVTNGMTTTTIPLTYSGDSSRVLCSYEEGKIGVNSMVRVKDNAAECCCPPWLSAIRASKVGAYLCPKRRSGEGGPFAPSLKSLEEEFVDDLHQQDFPWCPRGENGTDVLMCTQERPLSDELPENVAGKCKCSSTLRASLKHYNSSPDWHTKSKLFRSNAAMPRYRADRRRKVDKPRPLGKVR